MTQRYALVGRGIANSPSPAMHSAAFAARGIDATYELCDIAAEGLPGFIAAMRAGALDGCNVTIPHKAAVAAECDRLDGDAATLRSVNTVIRDGDVLVGLNTDAAGFELALGSAGLWPEAGCTALVLGSGGAAAAVVLALSRAPAARVVIAARTGAAAAELLARAAPGAGGEILPWLTEGVAPVMRSVDVLVNATPLGVDELPLVLRDAPRSCTVADVRYRPRPVDLVAAAQSLGMPATDGAGMLLAQGMLSFAAWTAEEAPWAEAQAALQQALDG